MVRSDGAGRLRDPGSGQPVARPDTHEKRGGGGAIDLTMRLLGVSFVEAVKRLSDHGEMGSSSEPSSALVSTVLIPSLPHPPHTEPARTRRRAQDLCTRRQEPRAM